MQRRTPGERSKLQGQSIPSIVRAKRVGSWTVIDQLFRSSSPKSSVRSEQFFFFFSLSLKYTHHSLSLSFSLVRYIAFFFLPLTLGR